MDRLAIITRTQPGADATAEKLCHEGWTPLVMPALEIVLAETDSFQPPLDSEIPIFTSANGVAMALRAGWKAYGRVVCVGPSTSDAAKDAGYHPVLNANGASDQVLELIIREFKPGTQSFVHIANSAAAGQIVKRLNGKGFPCRFVPLYDARAIAWGDVDQSWSNIPNGSALLVYSRKGAEAVSVWLTCGRVDTSELHLVCVSDNCLPPFEGQVFESRTVAKQPNDDEVRLALQSLPRHSVG